MPRWLPFAFVAVGFVAAACGCGAGEATGDGQRERELEAPPVADDSPEDAGGRDDGSRLLGVGRATPPEGAFVDISATRFRTCGVRVDGRIECWGDRYAAGGVPLAGDFEKVSIAERQACGVRSDRSLVCWSYAATTGAEQVVWEGPAGPFKDVSVEVGCGLREDGQLDCWYGADRLAPPEDTFVEIAGAGEYGPLCALNSGGWLVCWHDPALRPLGDVYADLGSYFACGIGADEEPACWRYGPGSAPLEGTEPMVSAELWGHRACGVSAEGLLACWDWDTEGWNTGGMWDPGWLGVPDAQWARVAGPGSEMPCLLSRRGELFCAGTYFSYDTPPEQFERISGSDRFVDTVVGGRHGCGIRTDGTVVCWGYDSDEDLVWMPVVR